MSQLRVIVDGTIAALFVTAVVAAAWMFSPYGYGNFSIKGVSALLFAGIILFLYIYSSDELICKYRYVAERAIIAANRAELQALTNSSKLDDKIAEMKLEILRLDNRQKKNVSRLKKVVKEAEW
jgi:hypothetical protein